MRNIIRWGGEKIRGMRRAEDGGITFGFTLLSGLFLLLLCFMFELCRFAIISSVIDLTLSRSVKLASTSEGKNTQYGALFRKTLRQEGGIWAWFIDDKKFSIEVKYCQTVAHASRNYCTAKAESGRDLAIYRVAYEYKPLLCTGVIPGTQELINTLQSALSFQLVYVQEYERNGNASSG